MKHTRIFITATLAGILHISCGNMQELPAILKEHQSKASFTKISDGTARLTPLFNGKDLTGWYTYTQTYGKNNDVEKAFTVENGTLHFDGEAMGYLCTSNAYRDYYLRVVFRWGEKKYAPRLDRPRDSGILYHFAESQDDKVWPTSVECQVQENDCGDYYLVGDATLESPNADSDERLQRVVRTENFEKPNSEWNTIEVICLDNTSEHYVNGHKVNEAYNLSVAEGKILLQLEGAEIFYKTVELLPLK
ncbi:MAG: DUF1080 domain-containing protein [Prevotellaceae bacterium]|nr:DUF1080 domain-containing protein [Prevotellaceae bacterium]